MLLNTLFAVPAAALGFFLYRLTAASWSESASVRVGNGIGPEPEFWHAASFAIGLSVLVLWLLLIGNFLTVWLTVLFLLTYGVLLGCSVPVQSTILVNVFLHERATAVGIYNFFSVHGCRRRADRRRIRGSGTGSESRFFAVGCHIAGRGMGHTQRHTHDPLRACESAGLAGGPAVWVASSIV